MRMKLPNAMVFHYLHCFNYQIGIPRNSNIYQAQIKTFQSPHLKQHNVVKSIDLMSSSILYPRFLNLFHHFLTVKLNLYQQELKMCHCQSYVNVFWDRNLFPKMFHSHQLCTLQSILGIPLQLNRKSGMLQLILLASDISKFQNHFCLLSSLSHFLSKAKSVQQSSVLVKSQVKVG